jgi:hypothetical protein
MEPFIAPEFDEEYEYNVDTLLMTLTTYQREVFNEDFPASTYDDITRHRKLVTGEISLDKDACRPPRVGIFFLAENGERKIYGGTGTPHWI